MNDRNPSRPTPSPRLNGLGVRPVMQALTDRFYDLMDMEPAYTELRAAHGP